MRRAVAGYKFGREDFKDNEKQFNINYDKYYCLGANSLSLGVFNECESEDDDIAIKQVLTS